MNNNYGPAPRSMKFGEAILSCFNKYGTFEGRASRSEFWYFFLFNVVCGIIAVFINLAIEAIFFLVTILPFTAVGCRRMHDINKSGWWQLVPIYNLILWAEDSSSGTPQRSSSESRNYSEPPRSRSGKSDLTDELEELQQLYEDGTLSEAQFKKAKEKLLK
tara:strand:+ start:91 stop:573 length:483 start_codon:yes stop_codon:yes gene_type:complete